MEKKAEIKTYTKAELAALYGVSIKVFRRWLKPFIEEIGQNNGWYFTPQQIEIIFTKLGEP